MENASKALLIAGAILIVILLIAVGMIVYSKSKGAVNTGITQTDSMDTQMFFNQFAVYEGKNKDEATVKLAVKNLINNNRANEGSSSKMVGIIYCYGDNYGSYNFNGGHSTDIDWIEKEAYKVL